MSVQVKICGITHREDAERAERWGATHLGVVLSAGFGRSVTAERAAEVVDGRGVRRVAVLVDETARDAATLARAIDASAIQLHGAESVHEVERLRGMGDWSVWKSVRARALEDVARTVGEYGAVVDGILVEGWREGVVGGGGVTLGLEPSEVRAAIPESLLFVLAGGLGPSNVAQAVARFRPDVVDVSSGIEVVPGRKDPRLLRRFIEAAVASGLPQGAGIERSRDGRTR